MKKTIKMIMMLAVVVCASMMTSCQVMFNSDSELRVSVSDQTGADAVGATVYLYKATATEAQLNDYLNAKTTAKMYMTTDEKGMCTFVIEKGEFVAADPLAFILQTFDAKGKVNSRTAVNVHANGITATTLNYGNVAKY